MTLSKEQFRERAYAELLDKANIAVDGIRVSDEVAKATGAGVTVKEGGHLQRGGPVVPFSFRTPTGLDVGIRPSPAADYELRHNGRENSFYVTRDGEVVYDKVTFEPRPKYYDYLTSDGRPMKEIVSIVTNGCAAVWYSNECAFKERGEDCLFCGINYRPGDAFLKTPEQIAESVKAAYDEGVGWRVDFTGGVIPERREIEYYSDAIEAIQDTLGRSDLIAAACVAGPRELSNLDRLREAGFSIITMNIEVWDENFFKTICPGKARMVGRENWIKALEYAAELYGAGHVRCNFVTGIEPKFRTLEGVEYLSSVGVVANPNIFHPAPGTPLEGTRCPTAEWNLDLQERVCDIQRRAGLKFEDIINVHPVTTGLFHDFWRIKEELLPGFAPATA